MNCGQVGHEKVTHILVSTGITRSPTYPLTHEYMWIFWLLIELQRLSKDQKNSHDQFIWAGTTF